HREPEESDEEEFQGEHHATSLPRDSGCSTISTTVVTPRITSIPPTLAMMRLTRPSLRWRESWMTKVSSRTAAATTGIQVRNLSPAKTATRTAPTSAAIQTGGTLRDRPDMHQS